MTEPSDPSDRPTCTVADGDTDTQFRNLVEASPMGVHMYQLEPDGRLVFIGANPAADRILDVDNSAFVGKTIEEAFPPLADTEIPDRYRAAAARGIAWQTEQVDYQDDRIKGAFEVYAFQTAPMRMAAMFLDVTERRRAEEEQRKLSALIESSNEFIGIANPEGQVLYLNAAGQKMVGLESLAEAKQKRITDFVQPDFLPALTETVVPAALRDGSVRGEDHLRHFVTGEEIDVAYELFVIRPDLERKGVNLAIVAADVSARKAAEVDRIALEEQLRHAQKMEAVGRLAGGVAHDFNNILTGIIGYADLLLLDLAEGDPAHADATEIRQAADRAAALTSQLLAFSRKQVTTPKVVDPNEIVARSKRMLERIIGEDVRLVFAAGHRLWRIHIDPAQLDQILVNMAVNARDAMPGGGQLTIETANVPAERAPRAPERKGAREDLVKLSIGDNGCGMDRATVTHIFEPFFSTKEKERGTGLGLATVYGIVKQNGGFIEVHSEPGAGACFDIYFPAIMADAERLEDTVEAESVRGTETILLVEDEPLVRRLAQRVLERQGYRVLAVGSGGDALLAARVHDGPIELLLTDVVMPGMNGRELHEELKKVRPELRVLFMSGYTASIIAQHGVLDRHTAFLPKPFNLETLTRKVRQMLDG